LEKIERNERGEDCALNYLNYVLLEHDRKLNADTHNRQRRKICARKNAGSNIQNKRFTGRNSFFCTQDFQISE